MLKAHLSLSPNHKTVLAGAFSPDCSRVVSCSADRLFQRAGVFHWQPTGLNPLYHRDDSVDRPRAMGVRILFSKLVNYLQSGQLFDQWSGHAEQSNIIYNHIACQLP